MNTIQKIGSLARYYFNANTKYSIDSPFVYEFLTKVLEDDRWFYAFDLLEKVRNRTLKNHQKIKVTDFGAGSHIHSSDVRSISQIANTSLTRPAYAQFLFSLIHHYKPKKLLELGTSLGITTMYQASAALESFFITLEGCPNIAQFAQRQFQEFDIKNVQVRVGAFEKTLDKALRDLKQVDYVFLDGNHQKEPTIAYFEKCLAYAHNDSIFVFDDIHWSADMEAAWHTIQDHPQVTLTIDLYQFGIVFFRKEQKEKAHYQLIDAKLKPWRMGFFR